MKYGLNMMGVCDLRGRSLWVEARFPCAASDIYAFDDSHLSIAVIVTPSRVLIGSAPKPENKLARK